MLPAMMTTYTKEILMLCVLVVLCLNSNTFGMDKPIKLPHAEELKVRLILLGRDDLMDNTPLVEQLADKELTPLKVAECLEIVLFNYFKPGPDCNKKMELNDQKSAILTVLLQEHHSAIEYLEKLNIIK